MSLVDFFGLIFFINVNSYHIIGIPHGILEFRDKEDAEKAVDKLDGKRISGEEERLKVRMGADK